MKPETRDALQQADAMLQRARQLLASRFAEEAGRGAYLAALTAAQALVFEHTHSVAKTHSGVRALFAKIVHESERLVAAVAALLKNPP